MSTMGSLVFDLDGTLVDSLKDISKACNHALRQVNAPPRSDAEVRSMIGGGVHRLLARALETKKPHTIEEARRHFGPAYRACLLEHTALYPGMKETLDTLHAHGYALCIATNKPRAFSEPIVKQLKLERWFRGWACGDEVANKKPDPAVIKLALKRAGLDTDTASCVYVGDMQIDNQTAHNAGCPSIQVAWGFSDLENPEYPPDFTVDVPSQLVTAVRDAQSLAV
jgi:phosphoglycolate phosphatase